MADSEVGSEDRAKDLLEARVSYLEGLVKFLLHVNGLDYSALRDLPDQELLKYYQDAVQLLSLQSGSFPPEIIDLWAPTYIQLSEFEILRLRDIVEYHHTWEPFYTLCLKMMTALRQNPQLGSSMRLQQLYIYLEKGRRNLRDIAVVMSRKYPDALSQKAKALLTTDDLAACL